MISFINTVKRYGKLTAVDSISLEIQRGEFCAVLGPNGAGKTTCIRMLMDFTRPSSGSVLIDGRSPQNPSVRSLVGYLPERISIPAHLSARRYLKRTAELFGLSKTVSSSRADELIELVGMKGRENVPAGKCSKGMVQRIGLAASLIGRPAVLILDEPASGLDPVGIRDVRLILERLKSEQVTLLLSSHLLSEAEKVCTTAVIIDKGKLALRETMENIINKGESLEDIFIKSVQSHP
jgi:ABC-2 type transport system ATP-binding protein